MEYALTITLLALSEISAIVYLITQLYKKGTDKTRTWLVFVFLLLCPVAGPAFFAFSLLLRKVLFRSVTPKSVAEDEPQFIDGTALVPDEESEMNIVSMEEAMIVSHKSDLRRLLLNLLKDGAENSLGAIAMALESDDSEASHYSASAIADSLASFQAKVQANTADIERKPKDPSGYTALIETLIWFLDKGILSDRETATYLTKAGDAMETLLEIDPSCATSSFFLSLTRLYIGVGDLSAARHWAEQVEIHHPNTLDSYTAQLQVCFASEDIDGFGTWLERLKASKVVINKEVLDIIHTLG